MKHSVSHGENFKCSEMEKDEEGGGRFEVSLVLNQLVLNSDDHLLSHLFVGNLVASQEIYLT